LRINHYFRPPTLSNSSGNAQKGVGQNEYTFESWAMAPVAYWFPNSEGRPVSMRDSTPMPRNGKRWFCRY